MDYSHSQVIRNTNSAEGVFMKATKREYQIIAQKVFLRLNNYYLSTLH